MPPVADAPVTIVDDPAGLTADWLTGALAADGIEGTVSDVVVAPLGTGQMASCFTLDVTYAAGDGPARLVAKLPSADPAVRAAVASSYRTEVGFYRELAPRLRVAVPRCHLASVTDDGTAFTLLLEDMAPAGPGDQVRGATPEAIRAAAIAAAGLHADSWCDETIRDLDWLIPPMSVLAEHIALVFGAGVDAFLANRQLDERAADVLLRFGEQFEVWALGRSAPWSLVHNDYRLDNLLFGDGPAPGQHRVTVVDWQSLTTGPPLRDVAFLLGTGLDPTLRAEHERAIVRAYHEELEGFGVAGYDEARAWDDYRHGLFQGLFICVMGEAFSAPTERGRAMFTAMAERCVAALNDHDALAILD